MGPQPHTGGRRWAIWLIAGLAGLAGLYVLAGGFIASSLIDKVLTVGAMSSADLQQPAVEGPFDIGYVGDPNEAFGMAFSEVMIPTELGPAPAWLVPGAPDAPVWAVYVHGIAGRRENGFKYLSVLHEAGIPTLIITYRNDAGAPAAPDNRYGFGLGEWRDLDAAVLYLLDQGALAILLSGESMGGGIIGQFLMQSEQAEHVVAVALDAPALDFPAVVEATIKRLGAPLPNVLAPVAVWFAALRTGAALGDAVSMNVLATFGGPLFLSHGTGDTIVPVSISDRLVTSRHGATTYLRMRAEHIQSWQENPDLYRTQFRAFIETLR